MSRHNVYEEIASAASMGESIRIPEGKALTVIDNDGNTIFEIDEATGAVVVGDATGMKAKKIVPIDGQVQVEIEATDIYLDGDTIQNGDYYRTAGHNDFTQRYRCSIFEDFFRAAAGTLEAPWTIQDTSSAGTPVIAFVDDALNGEFSIAHDAQSEAQNIGLNWGDQLVIDPTKNPVLEVRLKINFAGAAFSADQRFVVGLATARNATLDSVAQHAWFRIEGASLAILAETDDGTTDDDDNATGVSIVDNTYLTLRIDMSDTSAINFYANNALVATLAAAALSASHKMQFFLEMQRDAGTEVEAVVVDYVKVEWDRT